jgi:lipopolysaccharide heptosyltransferase II
MSSNATSWADADDGERAALEAAYAARPPFEARLTARVKMATKSRAQRLLKLLIAALGFLTRTGQAAQPLLQAGNPAIQRILVIRVDLIGDVVLSLPAIRVLKRAYPQAEIDMLVLGSSAGILAGQPEPARVLTFDPYLWRHRLGLFNPRTWREAYAFLGLLRRRRYDLAISIAGDIASILARLSGAPRRLGYADEAYPFMLTDPLPGGRYSARQHEVRYVLRLAEAAGGRLASGDEHLALQVLPEAAMRIQRILRDERARLGRTGPVITMHGGARNGQAKRWPTAHIAALTDRLVRELDALVVLTGAPNEASLARAVLRRTQSDPLNLCGKTSLPELAGLLAASDLVISGDSGPLHIACAVGTPVVALHGPTDPALSGPTAPGALVLRLPLWCAPCYDASATAECRFHNPVCMKDLTPALVFAAAVRQLQGRAARSAEGAERHASVASHP